MNNIEVPPQYVQDPWEKNMPGMGLGRDPQRSPMQWDSSPNAGFCPPKAKPWLPIAGDYKQVNVAAQHDDRHSMLSLTHTLLEVRRATPALARGSYTSIEGVPEDCYVYVRQFGGQRRLIALNFSGSEQHISLPEMGNGWGLSLPIWVRRGPLALVPCLWLVVEGGLLGCRVGFDKGGFLHPADS